LLQSAGRSSRFRFSAGFEKSPAEFCHVGFQTAAR